MQQSGNTILVTGGATGIGRGLAQALSAAGNTVIIVGRRADALKAAADTLPGVETRTLDVGDAGSIAAFAKGIAKDFPSLNVLVNNAGIMLMEDFAADAPDLSVGEATIATNLLGPMRLIAALLPHLRKQPNAAILNVTSGLAYVPRADAPTYSASKAALRSFTESLRHQLRKTTVQVIEIAPPLVATGLTPGDDTNPRAMKLADFLNETMALLRAHPEAGHIFVERVKLQSNAVAEGRYGAVFGMINPS